MTSGRGQIADREDRSTLAQEQFEEEQAAAEAGVPLPPERTPPPEPPEPEPEEPDPIPQIVTVQDTLEAQEQTGATIEPTKEDIVIGRQTDNPFTVDINNQVVVEELANIQRKEPKLFNTLVNQGLDEFNRQSDAQLRRQLREANAQRFVQKTQVKRFLKKNEQLPTGEFIDKSQLSGLKKTDPDIHKILTTQGIESANKKIQENIDSIKEIPKAKFDNAKFAADAIAFSLSNTPEPIVEAQAGTIITRSAPNIYRLFTPWQEEKGETFGQFILATPNRMFAEPETITQKELEAMWKAEQEAPFWAKALFGKTIIKKRDGTFSTLAIVEAPLIGGKKIPTPKLTRTKTIEINFNKILQGVSTKRKMQVDWDLVNRTIKLGRTRNAAQAARVGRMTASQQRAAQLKLLRRPGATRGGIKPKVAARIQRIAEQKELERIEKAIMQAVESATLERLRASRLVGVVIPENLTPQATQRLLDRDKDLAPGQALINLDRDNLLPVVALQKPNELADLMSRTTPETRTQVYESLSDSLGRGRKEKQLTKTQANALAQTIAQVQTKVISNTFAKTLGETKGQTKSKLNTKLSNDIQNKLKELPSTELKQKTQQQLATQTKQITPPKNPLKPTKPEKPVTKPPPFRTKPIARLPLPGVKTGAEAVGKAIRKGTIAWRQGEVTRAGKRLGVWWVIKWPYSKKSDARLVIGRPKGAKVVRGKLSAFRTIQTLTGKPPNFMLTLDLGAQDVIINRPTRKPGKRGAIKFKADPKGKTKGDISLKGIRA